MIPLAIVSRQVNVERRKSCLETWIPKLSPKFLPVFLVESPRMKGPYYHDAANHILYLKCREHYHDIPAKVRGFCRWAVRNFDCPYFLKCDDDTYVNARLVNDYPFHTHDYIGFFYETWHNGLGKAHGAFYSISWRCAETLARKLKLHGYEDDMVNNTLRANVPDLTWFWEPSILLSCKAEGMSDQLMAGHPIRPPEAMYDVHRVVTASW